MEDWCDGEDAACYGERLQQVKLIDEWKQ